MSLINTVLLIIELLFLLDGIWAIIFGKIPTGLFNFLFGLGEYKFPPTQTRLFGLLLASPLPVSYGISLLFTNLFGANGAVYATIFEFIYILVIMVTSIIIVRRAKEPKAKKK
jgi:hypothetical protein